MSFLKQNPFFNKKSRGFTLAEVLVVIAIIGLLGGIVVVATRGARERARIAKLLQFSSQIHHALGAYLIGEWRFNEGQDGTCLPSGDVCDTSGNGNHGTFNLSGDQWEDSDIPQLETTVHLAGGTDYVTVPDLGTLDGMNSLTVQVWFKLEGFLPTMNIINKDTRYRITISEIAQPERLILFIIKQSVGYLVLGFEYLFEAGRWYHFAGTYYGGTENDPPRMKIFLNGGELIKTETFSTFTGPLPVQDSDYPLWLGSSAPGFIDDIRIYEGELTSAQIKKHYVEGAIERGLLVRE